MASRVTPTEMRRLYRELDNYAAVGRKMGRSGSTVARYIKMKDCPALVRHTTKDLVRKV